jgi:hypothetical protein
VNKVDDDGDGDVAGSGVSFDLVDLVLLPSTRAIQVRTWSGSRRWASSNTDVMTWAVVAVTLAVSHLPTVRGPRVRAGAVSPGVVVAVAMMSAGVRGAGMIS